MHRKTHAGSLINADDPPMERDRDRLRTVAASQLCKYITSVNPHRAFAEFGRPIRSFGYGSGFRDAVNRRLGNDVSLPAVKRAVSRSQSGSLQTSPTGLLLPRALPSPPRCAGSAAELIGALPEPKSSAYRHR